MNARYQNALRYSVITKLSWLEKQMTNNNIVIAQRCRQCLAQNGAHIIHGVPELAYQPLTVYFNICSKRDFATINIQTLVVFKLKPF
jgi:hypothetical protein